MTIRLKTLIVDDDPIARKVLRAEIEAMDAEVVAEADSGISALRIIAQHKPDLVLLDLQMPEMGGLEVVRRLSHGGHMPAIVIVAEHAKFAVEALEAGAAGYLLKPVTPERLATSLETVLRLTNRESLERIARLREKARSGSDARDRKIVGRIGDEYVLLRSDEIYAFQADGNVVYIITANRRYIAGQTLKVLQARLADSSFRRIHRNALVSVDHIHKMSALSSQRWLITLNNDQEFIVSKRRADSVRELIRR